MNRTIEFVNDRISGMSFADIAEKHGVSRQYVHQELQKLLNMNTAPTGKKGVSDIIYPNIRKWFIKNNVSMASVERDLGIKNTMLARKLRGKSWFSKDELDSILKKTGLTYEEAFMEEEESQ